MVIGVGIRVVGSPDLWPENIMSHSYACGFARKPDPAVTRHRRAIGLTAVLHSRWLVASERRTALPSQWRIPDLVS